MSNKPNSFDPSIESAMEFIGLAILDRLDSDGYTGTVETYEEFGYLTKDSGLVIYIEGNGYSLTITPIN